MNSQELWLMMIIRVFSPTVKNDISTSMDKSCTCHAMFARMGTIFVVE